MQGSFNLVSSSHTFFLLFGGKHRAGGLRGLDHKSTQGDGSWPGGRHPGAPRPCERAVSLFGSNQRAGGGV